MAGIRGTSHPESPELLQRIQNIEAMLGITGRNVGNGPGIPNSQEITGNHSIRDANGILRVRVGQLPSGDYGYLTQDPNGVSNEIWPTSSNTAAGPWTTASATPVTIAGTPTVSCYIGASKDALITLSCFISSATVGNSSAGVYLEINGTTTYGPLLIAGTTLGGAVEASCCLLYRASQSGILLNANADNLFAIQLSSSAGTAEFSTLAIVVQPL